MLPSKRRPIYTGIKEMFPPSGYRIEGVTPRMAQAYAEIEKVIYAQYYMPMHYMPFILELSSQVPGKKPDELFTLADQYEQDKIEVQDGETVSPGGIILGG